MTPSSSSDAAVNTQARADKLAQLQDRLHQQVDAIRSGDQWKAWLATASKFHSYSLNNVLLIHAQAPQATQVAGYQVWKSLGRQVRKGEKGIAILAPMVRKVQPEDDEHAKPTVEAPADGEPARKRITGWVTVHVFDILQTQGEDLPAKPRPQLLAGQAPPGLWDSLAEQVTSAGFTLERGPCGQANGHTDFLARTVRVRHDVDDLQACKTLAHELGHVTLHDSPSVSEPSTMSCRGTQEVEAESVAYLVVSAHGVDTDSYSFPYVAGWIGSRDPVEALEDTGRRVLQTAHTILETIDGAEQVDAAHADLGGLRGRAGATADRAAHVRAQATVTPGTELPGAPAPGAADSLLASQRRQVLATHPTQQPVPPGRAPSHAPA